MELEEGSLIDRDRFSYGEPKKGDKFLCPILELNFMPNEIF